jgi:hypothetical protein
LLNPDFKSLSVFLNSINNSITLELGKPLQVSWAEVDCFADLQEEQASGVIPEVEST